MTIHPKFAALHKEYEAFIKVANQKCKSNNGIFQRYENAILTRDHIPPYWLYDIDIESNPNLLLRLGVNTVFNAGAIKLGDKFVIIPRIEGFDVKSFFAVAESNNGIDGWRFRDYPIKMPVTDTPETNVYDIRLTLHEDGWIYGLFCAERKDQDNPNDSSAAVASCGIARTKDLDNWERLPDLKSTAAQQRNCVLHPEFVKGKYMIYTRPQSGFIETGDSGISAGFTEKMNPAILDKELLVDPRKYHTVKEVKNGQGPPPIKTQHGWIHLAHGVRHTAAGLRYVLYAFMTDLKEPWTVIRRPGGHLIEPLGDERVGDVSNVVFSNGWILDGNDVYIYYASSDTRMHVATTSLELLLDYVLNTPEDGGISSECVKQRISLIEKNLKFLR